MRKVYYSSLFAWGLLVLVGCGGDGAPQPSPGDDVKVPATTKVLDDQTIQRLQSVSADRRTFTFSTSSALLNNLAVGDIIVAGIEEPHLPDGTLSRITAINTSAGSVVVTAEPASLAEAVEEGTIQTRVKLEPIADASGATGAKIIRTTGAADQLVFSFDNVVLFDGDGNEVDTTHDQVVLSGNLGLDPEVVIDIDISGFSLEKATIAIETTATSSLTIEAGREATLPPFEKPLLTVPMGKIIVPLGPIPVVFVPELELRVGADGMFSAKMTTEVTVDADTEVGLGYDGSFGPILNVDPEGKAAVPSFQDGATASAKVWIGARFNVSVYGLAGVFVESRFYTRAVVDTAACPWWELYAGIEGQAGAFAGIDIDWVIFDFHIKIFEWSTDPLFEEKLVADAGGCAPSAPAEGTEHPTWARSYGGDAIDFPVALAAAPDGATMLAGQTFSFTSGSPAQDAWLMKLDALGHIAWEQVFDDLDVALAVAPTTDGYYLLAGEVSILTERPSYLLKLDHNGLPVWSKALWLVDPQPSLEEPFSIFLCPGGSTCTVMDAVAMVALPDGGAVVSGSVRELTETDVWVSRFDQTGALLWAQTLGGSDRDEVVSMALDDAGKIAVLADSRSFSSPGCSWLVRLDQDGTVLSQACYGGDHNNFGSDIVPASTGYYIVADLGGDIEVTSIDDDGKKVWVRHYDTGSEYPSPLPGRPQQTCGSYDQPYDDVASATLMPDGDLLVLGSSGLGEQANLWALRLNPDGNVEWSRVYGGTNSEKAGGLSQYGPLASTALPASGGGALIAGYTESFGAGNLDAWVVRIRDTGAVTMDSESGAFSSSISGGSCEREHFTVPTSVSPVPLPLTVIDYATVRYSTEATVVKQAGPD